MQDIPEILRSHILRLRKEAGMTQEALAERLGITFQAVSKWENGQSCPDISLLPLLADIFGVSVDALFGREASPAAAAAPLVGGLPWSDDPGTLHAVLYRGHRLLLEFSDVRDRDAFAFTYSGPALNIAAMMDVEVRGPVTGSITSNGDVEIKGDVQADRVTAMGDLNCSGISAPGDGAQLRIMGDTNCGDIACGSGAHIRIDGDAELRSLECGPESTLTVAGDLEAGDAVVCASLTVEGDLEARVVRTGQDG